MKRMIKIVIFLILFCSLGLSVSAESENDLYNQFYEESDVESMQDSLPDEIREIFDDLKISPSDPASFRNLSGEGAFGKIFGYIKDFFSLPFKSFLCLISVILICALAKNIGGEDHLGVRKSYYYLSSIAVGTTVLIPVSGLVKSAGETIAVCSGFMIAFIPVFIGILIAMARAGTAAGTGTLLFSAAEVISVIGSKIVTPFISMFLALSAAASLSHEIRLKGFIEGFRKITTWILAGGMTIFTGILSLQTAIGSASDNVISKTARFFTGTFVPVIGTSIAESLTTVQSCVGLLKSGVGIYGVLAVVFFFVPILIQILLWRLCLMLASAIASLFLLDNICSILDAVSKSLSLLNAVILSVSLLFIISVTVISMSV